MPLYAISYDAHRERNYANLYQLMESWGAKRLHLSLWLAQLRGPAEAVRDIVASTLDGDDSTAVIELEATAEWAVVRALPEGIDWLRTHIPFRG